jgi:hypothetical protein
MSWEVDREEEKPCPCGQGTYLIQHRSDDWNRYDERWIMNCPTCNKMYKIAITYGNDKGISYEKHAWVKK